MRDVATAVQVLSTAAGRKIKMQLLRVACVLSVAHAFVAPHVARQPVALRGAPEDAADAKIDSFVKDNKVRAGVRSRRRTPPQTPSTRRHRRDAIDATLSQVMLFMKGTKIFPQCGFSNMAVQILNAIGADFETCDVLSDDFIRQQIKVYSDWPTIPQLYVDGEFVGGSDIMLEMYQAGELQEMIEVAAAS